MRLFAVLFTGLFLIGAFPVFFLHPYGSASAGVTAGFTVPLEKQYHIIVLIAIGLLSAWGGEGVVLILPLCTLLMMVIGSLMNIGVQAFHQVEGFTVGGILLFSLCMSMLRNKIFLLFILPASLWGYLAGVSFIGHIPSITTPLFFLMGIILCCTLLLAMGITLGITTCDPLHRALNKLKRKPLK